MLSSAVSLHPENEMSSSLLAGQVTKKYFMMTFHDVFQELMVTSIAK